MIELDALDWRLLDCLQEHGRISNLELAAAVHLSAAQCHRRHKRLEESGLIRRYETRLDPAGVGVGVVAFVQVSMERGHIREVKKFRDAVQKQAQVQECYAITGDADYMLKVAASDLKSLSDFLLGTIAVLPGVHSVRSSVCLDEIKCTAALPLKN
jgi:Lrp/AsnC family leucine-responsive transcriptional regulator